MPRKIFIIACEPSGDQHGAALVHALKQKEPGLEIRGLGGPLMKAEGVQLLDDMTRISALGLGDVLRLYFVYRKIFYNALRDVQNFKPDALILIDSPAFNLRFAKKIKKRFPTFYYISPQLWAWGSRRIKVVKKNISKMIVILPFEKDLYQKAGVPCEFVGHPLLDHNNPSEDREALRRKMEIKPNDLVIGLLPGSRKKEVERIFPALLETAALMKQKKSECVFFLARSGNVPSEVYDEILKKAAISVRTSHLPITDLLSVLDFGLIASGTSTLQAALSETPFFLVYKASWTTYVLGRLLIRVPFLGLANLLAGKSIVPEFIQDEMKPEVMAEQAVRLLNSPAKYSRMKEDLAGVRKILGEKGASIRAADIILKEVTVLP